MLAVYAEYCEFGELSLSLFLSLKNNKEMDTEFSVISLWYKIYLDLFTQPLAVVSLSLKHKNNIYWQEQ